MAKKHLVRVVALMVLFILALGGNCICGKKLTGPVDDNPLDPDSPDYVPPVITIKTGPPDHSVLATDAVTFTFSGNTNVEQFRYWLSGRDSGWRTWDTVTTVSYLYLDEGDYIFYLSGRSSLHYEVHDTVRFTINNVAGPALMLTPKYVEVGLNQQFTLGIRAEEVADLMLAEAVVVFDRDYFQVVKVDTGSFLAGGGAQVVLIDTTYDSTVVINVGRVLGDSSGVTGSGVVARITFKALAQATGLSIGYSAVDSSSLYQGTWENDKDKNAIPLKKMTGTLIDIK